VTFAAPEEISSSYYEGLADELDLLAESLRNHPNLRAHFAGRLQELAQQLRDDVRLMALKASSN
jgi:hypothetical protein